MWKYVKICMILDDMRSWVGVVSVVMAHCTDYVSFYEPAGGSRACIDRCVRIGEQLFEKENNLCSKIEYSVKGSQVHPLSDVTDNYMFGASKTGTAVLGPGECHALCQKHECERWEWTLATSSCVLRSPEEVERARRPDGPCLGLDCGRKQCLQCPEGKTCAWKNSGVLAGGLSSNSLLCSSHPRILSTTACDTLISLAYPRVTNKMCQALCKKKSSMPECEILEWSMSRSGGVTASSSRVDTVLYGALPEQPYTQVPEPAQCQSECQEHGASCIRWWWNANGDCFFFDRDVVETELGKPAKASNCAVASCVKDGTCLQCGNQGIGDEKNRCATLRDDGLGGNKYGRVKACGCDTSPPPVTPGTDGGGGMSPTVIGVSAAGAGACVMAAAGATYALGGGSAASEVVLEENFEGGQALHEQEAMVQVENEDFT
ncbi:MAG: uncharacterized protein KVP18_003485 [Porospora cf. gigantea A]|uniref:uncharacterized protein n=1 Tax=Porospora cf. gigantea A TaxID=2853593 RepID=UPI003559435B|nr:MAG: hypothetical protein KVP18_003485 [Porospora cf. gigantea A]